MKLATAPQLPGGSTTETGGFGLVANGLSFAFLKLQRQPVSQFDYADTIAPRARQNHLHDVLPVLKAIARAIAD